MAIALVVWFRSAILLDNLGGVFCSCYFVKVKSTPSLDVALGVWQKIVVWQILGPKIFWFKKSLGQKIFLGQENFCFQKSFRSKKNFGSEKDLGSNRFVGP